MYEEEILRELKMMNERLARIESVLVRDRDFGGVDFKTCLMRIMYGVE